MICIQSILVISISLLLNLFDLLSLLGISIWSILLLVVLRLLLVVAALLIVRLSCYWAIVLLKGGDQLMGLGELQLQLLVILGNIDVGLGQVGHLALQVICRESQGWDLGVKFLDLLSLSIKVGLKSLHLLLELFNLKPISLRWAWWLLLSWRGLGGRTKTNRLVGGGKSTV